MILGIDIGGTKVALGVADHEGRLLAQARLTAPGRDPEGALRALADEARRLLVEAGGARFDAAGVSAPGPLDRASGRVLGPPNLAGWDDVPVTGILAEALGCDVALENDANAAALAEWRFGAGQGTARLVYLTMSTGVGAGLVLDSRLYRGRGDHAGEVGHAPIAWDGARCACGLRGCFEAYVGGRAWTAHLRRRAPRSSGATERAGGAEHVQPEHVVVAARDGDAWSRAELERYAELLARGLVHVAFAYAPDVIVLGTIVRAAGDLVLEPLRRRVAERVWPGLAEGLRVEAAALGDEGAALAGVSVALEALADG